MQFQFVLAELVVIQKKIHARRVDHDVAIFLASAGTATEARIPGRLLAG